MGYLLALTWLIHPIAWKENSANFAITALSEVELPLSGILGSLSRVPINSSFE